MSTAGATLSQLILTIVAALLELDPVGGLAIGGAGPCVLSSVERAIATAEDALPQESARRNTGGLGSGIGLILG